MAAEGSGSMPPEGPGSDRIPEEGSSSKPEDGSGSGSRPEEGSGSGSMPAAGEAGEASGSGSVPAAGEASGSGAGGRRTRGRQKIPMQLIQNQDDLYASFSKRRQGIYKKATELCTLCDVDIGIIMFSPTDLPYSFFHPNMDSVIYRSMHPEHQLPEVDQAVDRHMQGQVAEMNQHLDRINDSNDAERVRFLRAMEEIERRNTWMRQRLSTLPTQQLMVWRAWFKEFKTRVNRRTEQINHQLSMAAAAAEEAEPLPPPEFEFNVEDMAGGSGAGGRDNVNNEPRMLPGQEPGQFYYPGETSNDPVFGGGGASSNRFFSHPAEGQGLFTSGGPSVGSFQEFNLGALGGGPSYHRSYMPPPPSPGLFDAGPSGDPFYYPVQPPQPNQDEAGPSGSQFYYSLPSQDEAGPSGSQFYYPPNQDEAGPSSSNQFYYPAPPNEDEAGPSGSQFYYPAPPNEDEAGPSGSQFYYPDEDEAGPSGSQFYHPDDDEAGPSNQKDDGA